MTYYELMLCQDGAEHQTWCLTDGNDSANAHLERRAIDTAYELKESNPDAVVSLVFVMREEGNVTLPREDFIFIAESLETLQGLDEGEHTDWNRLGRVAESVRRQVGALTPKLEHHDELAAIQNPIISRNVGGFDASSGEV